MNPLGGDCFASSAIRCCRVDTRSRFDAPALFPSNGLCQGALLPLDGLPGWFARRTGTMRTLRLLPPVSLAHCVRFAIPTPRLVLCSLQYKTHFRRAWGLIVRRPPDRFIGNAGDGRPPRFLENPRDGSPGSWTPVGSTRQAVRRADAAPACVNNEGSRRENFRGSMSKLSVWLSTLRRVGRPPTAQDSLPAVGPLYRAGLTTRRVPTKVSEV